MQPDFLLLFLITFKTTVINSFKAADWIIMVKTFIILWMTTQL